MVIIQWMRYPILRQTHWLEMSVLSFGDFKHHLKKYLLEIKTTSFYWCDVQVGHLPTNVLGWELHDI